jgi:hypothetical protein
MRKVIVTLETEVDERLCGLELDRNKTLHENDTKYRAYFDDDYEALKDIENEIVNRLNFNILRVEDVQCGNVMWVE